MQNKSKLSLAIYKDNNTSKWREFIPGIQGVFTFENNLTYLKY